MRARQAAFHAARHGASLIALAAMFVLGGLGLGGLVGLGALVSPAALLAQAPSAGTAALPLPLTLSDALERAARHNPGYRQVTNNLELNRIERQEVWLSVLPRPSFTLLSSGMDWNLQRVGTDNFGNPVENPEAQMVQSSRSGQAASLNLSLDFRNFLRLRQQETRAELRELTAVARLDGLQADVARAFLDAQERQLTLELEAALLTEAARNREAAERLYALARTDRMDLLSAELDYAEQENQLERSRAELRSAVLSLRNLIGDPELEAVELVPSPLRETRAGALDEEALVAVGLRESSRLGQQRGAILDAERGVAMSRAQWLPTLSLGFTTQRVELMRGGGDAFFSLNPSGEWDRAVRLSLSFPDLGRYLDIQGSTRAARLDVRNQEEELRQIRMEVEQEIRGLVVDLHFAERSVELQAERVDLAEEQLRLRMESYRLGQASYLDLQNASRQAAEARRQALQAEYARERALISLERTLGMSLAEAGVASGG